MAQSIEFTSSSSRDALQEDGVTLTKWLREEGRAITEAQHHPYNVIQASVMPSYVYTHAAILVSTSNTVELIMAYWRNTNHNMETIDVIYMFLQRCII